MLGFIVGGMEGVDMAKRYAATYKGKPVAVTIPENDERPITHAAHTPGPWKVELGDPQAYRIHERLLIVPCGPRDENDSLAPIAKLSELGPSSAANARLIAAAPDLLAAMESLVKYAENSRYISPRGMDACLAARAAIRKATGA